MAEELELELDDNNAEEIISRKDKRLKKLNDDIKETNEKLAKEAEEKSKIQAERDNAAKERDFYKSFNTVSSKHPAASEYQDKIWEKVKAGYDLEDATISILAKEGKYNPPAQKVEKEGVAGGSAANVLAGSGQKSLEEMSQAERREALREAEAKGEFRL